MLKMEKNCEIMKNTRSLIRLIDYSYSEIEKIFKIADDLINSNKYENILAGKTVIMFFPESSIRTRITFEKGIYLLGGQTILFSPEALNKKEEIRDVAGYLNNWADAVIVRNKEIQVIEKLALHANFPVINAMTDINHPCEILSDLYSLSKLRDDYLSDYYLFVGKNENIGLAWKEAADVMGFPFIQSCPAGYEIPEVEVIYDINEAVKNADIVCTDSLSVSDLNCFKDYQITKAVMDKAKKGALLNSCPPFYRGEEVSRDVIESPYFVGHEFKKHLLEVQQAVTIYCLNLNIDA
jgi:ornithine carbamoyltransferase